ncbi:FHS family L-fucose permease-like MFS transporter [Povalibacter uvarum]|uniref:FHS family L-fucose permease-like MFS transporter n=1 Tax=Povalibacter uvarum TaxID=732238 RepID=A0A841HQD8_9GAMM|nr:sugar MFS transporter [Povalibacter uvarum]MBB6094854.1 FHS family L-fucose permease-like MFS transporter [Povalibacter uvarum]
MNTTTTTATLPAHASSYRLAFILVTSLFFMWGLSYGLLDVLNKHFQETLGITRARSAWLQGAYFGAYFLMAMPAAGVIGRWGYKATILCGLCLFATGALLVIPSTLVASFPFFLGAMFIIASGLAFLETAANPYVTLLGQSDRSEARLNLSQSFNGLGQFVAPLIAASMLFSSTDAAADHAPVRTIYAVIAGIVLLLAVLTWRTDMPDGAAVGNVEDDSRGPDSPSLWSRPRFAWGVVAQFFYVAAQVCIGAFFINYVTEQHAQVGSADATRLLSVGMLCFLVGRFAGTALMTRIAPQRVLLTYAVINIGLTAIVVASLGTASVIALIALFFFMSIMFPTIFALAVKDLGSQTKRGSSYLIMSIVGGAIVPYLMGRVADAEGMGTAFLIPLACFGVVVVYAWKVGHLRASAT